MAGGMLGLVLIFVCRLGCLALVIAAMAVAWTIPTEHEVGAFVKAQALLMWVLLIQGWALSLALLAQAMRTCLGGALIVGLMILILTACELPVACLTFGTGCANLAVVLAATSRGVCAPAEACAKHLYAAVMTCLAGALGAFPPLGMVWLAGAWFRQQPQAA